MTGREDTVISYAGIGANILWAAISAVILLSVNWHNEYVLLFLWMFMTLHCAEIVSYLFVGNIFLVSDMASIAHNYPNLRWVNLLFGTILSDSIGSLVHGKAAASFKFVLSQNLNEAALAIYLTRILCPL